MAITPIGTLYANDVASSTLATAATFITTGGGAANTNRSTTIGTSTGWGIINALAGGPAWAASGSQPAPTGYGILWDVTTLEGQQILNGTWQPKSKLKVSVGSITATLVWRICVYHGWSGLISVLSSATLAAQSITTSFVTYTGPTISLARIPFGIGDKLFIDLSANITANATGSGAATLSWTDFAHLGNGLSTNSFTVPSYQPFSEPAVAAPLSQPYAATGVQIGGPYVKAHGSKLSYNGADLKNLYGATFYPAQEGGSSAWRTSGFTTVIDGVIAAFVSAKTTLLRPTDQWGSATLDLNWDDPVIWTNIDYLITQAYKNNLWVLMDLSGWKSWLVNFGYNPIDSTFWLPLLAAVGTHYQYVPNIAWYAIVGEPTTPTTTPMETALVAFSDTVTRALYAADGGNHLINAGGYNHMPDGLQVPPWWQALWALPYNTLCAFKCYSQNDLNGYAGWAQYGTQTLGKPTVMVEYGVPFSSGDGTYTGTPYNSIATDRADFFTNVYTIGEANGICAFAYWNYDHGNASGSFDTDPTIAPATWAVITAHAGANPQFFLPVLRPTALGIASLTALSDSIAQHIAALVATVGNPAALYAGQATTLGRVAALNDQVQEFALLGPFEAAVLQERAWITLRQSYPAILDLWLPGIAALDMSTGGLAEFLLTNGVQVAPGFYDAFNRAASFQLLFPDVPLIPANAFGPAVANMGSFVASGAGAGTFTSGSAIPTTYGNAPLQLMTTGLTGAASGTYTVSFSYYDHLGAVQTGGSASVTIPNATVNATVFALGVSGIQVTGISLSGGTTSDGVQVQSVTLRTVAY